MSRAPSIRLTDVAFGYREGSFVLRAVNLVLGPGLTLLVGPNGCGKSTLLKLMAGVERPDAGRVEVDGFDLWRQEAEARGRLAYVPEQPDVSPYASVVEVLELVAGLRGEPLERIREVQRRYGLDDLGGRSIRELSKGQRRRVLLAAAHLGEPPVLLFDEPLDALDRALRSEFLAWIERRIAAGALIVVVTHELETLAHLVTGGVSVVDGRTVSREIGGSARERLEALDPLARGARND